MQQQQWKINGVYANWTITVNIDPPDEGADTKQEILTRKPNFEGLLHHFRSIVDLNEAFQELKVT